MNSKFKLGAAAIAALALTFGGAGAAFASQTTTATGSTGAVYLISGDDGSALTEGTTLNWDDAVLAVPNTADITQTFPGDSTATSARYFVAPRGSERNISAWKAYGDLGFKPGTKELLSPNVSMYGLLFGDWNGLKTNGGDFSLGVANLNNNGLSIAGSIAYYVYIHVNAGGTWTFENTAAAPVVAVPTITTTSLGALTQGVSSTQTIAATGGTPLTWSVKSGALPAGLTLDATAGTVSGTPTTAGSYSFTLTATNSAGSDDQAFTGTVNAPAPTAPTEPTGTAAGKVTIADPAKGATSVTLPAGTANKGKTFDVWAWSTPTKIGQVTTDATTGDAVVDITDLPAGQHTVALVEPGDANYGVVSWGTFTKIGNDSDPKAIDLQAKVTASDLWSLNAEKTSVDFGEVARGATKTLTDGLGKVTVVDDRNVLKGWTLTAAASPFTLTGADPIPATALTITPKAYAGYTPVTGITAGATGASFAASADKVSTGTTGALFNADLAFAAPTSAQAGVYHSTLTFTLASK